MGSVLVESRRLLLRRPEEEDQGHLRRVFGDPEMMRFLGDAWSPEEVREVLLEWRDGWGASGRWHGVLEEKGTGMLVGTAGLAQNAVSEEPGLEISWFVLPECQRRGYATEISRVLVQLAFGQLNADRVLAETHPENEAAARLLEKLRFHYVGERQHAYDRLPGFAQQALWEMRRDVWEQMFAER